MPAIGSSRSKRYDVGTASAAAICVNNVTVGDFLPRSISEIIAADTPARDAKSRNENRRRVRSCLMRCPKSCEGGLFAVFSISVPRSAAAIAYPMLTIVDTVCYSEHMFTGVPQLLLPQTPISASPRSGESSGANRRMSSRPLRPATKLKATAKASTALRFDISNVAFAAFFERAPLVMFVYDPKSLDILRANAAAVAQYGYGREEYQKTRMTQLVDADERSAFESALRQKSTAPQTDRGQWQLRTREGRIIDVSFRTIRARAAGRQVDIAVVMDISAQKRVEAKLSEVRRRYVDLFRASPAPMWVYDAETLRFLSVNESAIQYYGYSRDEFLTMTLRDIRPPDEWARLDAEQRREKHDVVQHGEWRHRKRNGNVIDVQIATGPIDMSGRQARVAVITDVTELKRVTQALSEAERIAHLGSWEYEAASDTLTWSDEMYEIVGRYSKSDRLDQDKIWEYVHPDDRAAVTESVRSALLGDRSFRVDHRVVRQDGEVRWIQSSGQVVIGADGEVIRLFGIALDITERKLGEDRLAFFALHDGLTGLPNRLKMERIIAQSLLEDGADGYRAAVMILDLDRFKNINDALGHAVGDTLLQAISNRLRPALGKGDVIGRLGGDTFIIILRRIEDEVDVQGAAERALKRLLRPITAGGHELRISASVGVSVYPTDGLNADDLIKSAEGAMYVAKESGRNRVQMCAPDQQTLALDRLELENALSHALDRREFVLHFQPIVDFKSGKIVAAEALIRWNHPTRGMVPPGQFIPMAEDTGLIVPIGEWAIRQACRQIKIWRAAGHHDIRVAVNISGVHIRLKNFATTLSQAIDWAQVDPSALIVEITESTMMSTPQALETIQAVKKLGVSLSLDDFGTGYSSLANLRHFPFDVIKIDRSFVKELDVYDETVAKAVVALGHSLDMSVIAEGVETITQRDRLRELSCDGMQGFLFSRPLPAYEFSEMLSRDKRL
jgi:diguanylate cyclase (GGDEF)-like protein/PAS domain S-box-containing protein